MGVALKPLLLILIAGIALASEPPLFTLANPDGPPHIRCSITWQEFRRASPEPFAPLAGRSSDFDLAVAFVFSYSKDPGNDELMRCVAEMAASKPTQAYFDEFTERYRDLPIKTKRLWEIWVAGKLAMFLGFPEAAK